MITGVSHGEVPRKHEQERNQEEGQDPHGKTCCQKREKERQIMPFWHNPRFFHHCEDLWAQGKLKQGLMPEIVETFVGAG